MYPILEELSKEYIPHSKGDVTFIKVLW
ncbi:MULTISPECIES: hypothetical protein [Bacteroides]|uniref:Uncharacterized protein n=1 Tax=Bacteroides caecimuris TaxID=1796613 RepID=A0A1V0QD89_9BACE|nr:hypothetical protein A4V03_20550 [Bacteroides caecimuris]NDO60177.1 hypothetical protein [Bacteroides caecimuris]OXE68023.1 hypothetical protein ADH74_00455 [Bacteroides caecimuris]QQR19328.1 hypothetical protein I5Q79_17875 [Bacteroides caecimuris]TGY32281.1 hypothetical protein E5353_11925 [Bacteroides caecimuris]